MTTQFLLIPRWGPLIALDNSSCSAVSMGVGVGEHTDEAELSSKPLFPETINWRFAGRHQKLL